MRYISPLVLLFIIAIVLLSNPSSTGAQGLLVKIYPPTTLIGFRVGTSIASESLSEIRGGASNGLKFGLDGGLDLEHWFNDKWAIATGLSFTQKGVDQHYVPSTTGIPESGDDNYSMNFIEVPVLLKMAAGVGDAKPFVCVGPTFGFLTSSSETTNGTITPISNLTSYLENFSVSLYFGTGAMYRLGVGPTIFFDAGYETGLTKVFKSEPPRTFLNPIGQVTATANEIIVTIGVLWEL